MKTATIRKPEHMSSASSQAMTAENATSSEGATKPLLSEEVVNYLTPYWESKSPLRTRIPIQILLLESLMVRRVNRVTQKFGLKFTQFMALGCISHEKDGITHSQLGQRLMLSKTPITSIVDFLEGSGWVRRVADDKDRRVSRVVITEEGRQLWCEVNDAFIQRRSKRVSTLSDQEEEVLQSLMDHLLQAFAAEDPIASTLLHDPTSQQPNGLESSEVEVTKVKMAKR